MSTLYHRDDQQPSPNKTYQPQDPLYTRRQAAAYLNCEPQTLAVWACTGRYSLPYVRIGRSVRYRKSDLDAFIARNLHSAQSAG
ncbi:MAG: helix-turn-helix domain-containing protein [Candidatus Obscuribacterales bacterium]|nr:helix-turn-helix domain-containing protein [Candidatus Obscuribacterales bacterium]